jgi:hypothetical protein
LFMFFINAISPTQQPKAFFHSDIMMPHHCRNLSL